VKKSHLLKERERNLNEKRLNTQPRQGGFGGSGEEERKGGGEMLGAQNRERLTGPEAKRVKKERAKGQHKVFKSGDCQGRAGATLCEKVEPKSKEEKVSACFGQKKTDMVPSENLHEKRVKSVWAAAPQESLPKNRIQNREGHLKEEKERQG